MENSGYVIKVERALSIVSVQFWSTFPQKVNSFDVDVNWFYDNFSIVFQSLMTFVVKCH